MNVAPAAAVTLLRVRMRKIVLPESWQLDWPLARFTEAERVGGGRSAWEANWCRLGPREGLRPEALANRPGQTGRKDAPRRDLRLTHLSPARSTNRHPNHIRHRPLKLIVTPIDASVFQP